MRISEWQRVIAGSVARPFLLPGLICDETIWSAQLRDLAEYGPVAMPGFGSARSLGEMAELALAQAPARMSLVGHSMGARVALEMVRRAPERIERLALLDTGIHLPRPGEAAARNALVALGRDQGMAALVDRWLPPMIAPARREDPAVVEPLRAMCLRAGIETFEAHVAALLDRPEVESLLPGIGCPVLVGVGREDEWSPPHQHEAIAALVPGARLVVFEGAGHMAPVEAPDAVSCALLDWLGRPAG
jgi:pimeloyl-ACP methyl ester carboxylesterase